MEEIGKKNREAIGNIVENIRKKIKECNDVVGLFLKIIYSDSCEILVDSDLLSCVDISGYIQSGKTENKIRNIEKFAEYISDLFVGASLLSGVTVSTEHLDTIHSILDTVKGSVSKKDITKLRQYFMDMCLQNRSLNEKAALDLDREGAGNLTYETYTGPAKLAAERVKLRTEEKDERASKVPLKSLLTATCIARRYEDSLKFQLFEMVEKEILVSVENYNPFCVQMKDLLRRLKEEPLKTEVGSEIFSKPLPQNFERFFCEVMEPLESVCYNFFNGDESAVPADHFSRAD